MSTHAASPPGLDVRSVLRGRSILVDAGLITLGLVLLPILVSDFRIELIAGYLGFAVMAIGLDLVWGYTGILSIGQAAFFGTSAYVTAILIQQSGWSHTAAIAAGMAASLALAALVSIFVFYSKVGPFFVAIITLALGVLLEQVVNQFSTITGGFNGIVLSGLGPTSLTGRYILSAAVAVVAIGVAAIVATSDFGRVMRATRDDEERLRFLGYRTPLIKTIVFIVGGGFAAAGGLIHTMNIQYVSASNIGFILSTQVIIWTAIGGRASIIGPFLGAVGINLLGQSLSGALLQYWQLALGVFLVVVVMFAPDGLYPTLRRRIRVSQPETVRVHGASSSADGHRPALSVHALSKRFGALRAVTDVTFTLRPGEIVCLVGPNGAGKSTLVNTITGLHLPDSGTVTLGDPNLEGRPPEDVARLGLARTFQTPRLFDGLDVFENLLMASRAGRISARDFVCRSRAVPVPEHVQDFVGTGRLDEHLSETPPELSHGQRQWLELCMAMAAGSRMLLLDEPTAGLTSQDRASVGETLRDLAERHSVGLLLIEHDLDFVSRLADTILVMHQGALVASGPVAAIAADPVVRDVYLGASR